MEDGHGPKEAKPPVTERTARRLAWEAIVPIAAGFLTQDVFSWVDRIAAPAASTTNRSGTGVDPTTMGSGTGLQGMADRLAALGGSLDVRSTPGHGNDVIGRVPAGGT